MAAGAKYIDDYHVELDAYMGATTPCSSNGRS